MKKASGIIWGILLIAVGVLLALSALDIITFNIFFDGWWTLFILIPCTVGLFTDREKVGSLIGICVGVLLLLCCQGVLDFSVLWKLLLPAVAVIIGLNLLLKNLISPRHVRKSGDNVPSGTATFSETVMDFTGRAFEGADLNAVFGSVKCNLVAATVEKDCVINATAVFGGITISVPAGVNVRISSSSVFGGVSEKRVHEHIEGAPTLFINGSGIFGGVEIK